VYHGERYELAARTDVSDFRHPELVRRCGNDIVGKGRKDKFVVVAVCCGQNAHYSAQRRPTTNVVQRTTNRELSDSSPLLKNAKLWHNYPAWVMGHRGYKRLK
jgi:hypothetical protein